MHGNWQDIYSKIYSFLKSAKMKILRLVLIPSLQDVPKTCRQVEDIFVNAFVAVTPLICKS